MATITVSGWQVFAKAPTAFEAWSAVMEKIAEIGGDWEVSKPFDVGIANGAIVTGCGVTADRKDAGRPDASTLWPK